MARPLHQTAAQRSLGQSVSIQPSRHPSSHELRCLVARIGRRGRRRRRRRRHRQLVMRIKFSSRRGRTAFTLIELMVVIVIIGIMTAMMIPEMKGTFQDALLRSTSRELINVFDLAYSRAVSLNQLRRVRLDEKTGRYLVEKRVLENGQENFVPADDVAGGKGELDPRIAIEWNSPAKLFPDASEADSENDAASEESPSDEVTISLLSRRHRGRGRHLAPRPRRFPPAAAHQSDHRARSRRRNGARMNPHESQRRISRCGSHGGDCDSGHRAGRPHAGHHHRPELEQGIGMQTTAALFAAGQIELLRAEKDLPMAPTRAIAARPCRCIAGGKPSVPRRSPACMKWTWSVENARRRAQEIYALKTLLFQIPTDPSEPQKPAPAKGNRT
jgi:prepilin-type N-terminal cleavage/methylation domain-containing protein